MFNTKDALAKAMLDSGEFRALTDEELKQVQECLRNMYKDIMAVCKKHGFTPMLAGGSALGAVRHGGFIPWDDDFDILMHRDEYEKFLEIFEKEKGQEYYVYAPNYKEGAQLIFGRVYKKGTTRISMGNRNTEYPKCLFIDIFPIDYAPNSKLLQRLKGYKIDALRFISYSVYRYKRNDKYLSEGTRSSFKAFVSYRFRLLVGFIFSFRSYRKWFNSFDNAARGRESNFMTVPSGRKFYYGEVLPKEVFENGRTMKFDDIDAPVPKDVEKYLENLYGDYMQIPPPEKREKHLVYKFDLHHEYSE